MADPRLIRERLGFGYGAPSPAMSALEPFHAGVEPAYMPQDKVTESPWEGPRSWVRSGLESLFGTFAPSDNAAAVMADKYTNLSDWINPAQTGWDIGQEAGNTLQGGDPTMLAMSLIPGKAADELVPAVKAAQKVISLGDVRLQREGAKQTALIKDTVANFEDDALARGLAYHSEGKLPIPVGTRMMPPKGSGEQTPWEVTSHYVDPRNPDRYGYGLKDPQSGQTTEVIINDPKVGLKGNLTGWKPMKIGGVPDAIGVGRKPAERAAAQADPLVDAEYDALFGPSPDLVPAVKAAQKRR